jgi:two-component system chemotaxis response regulator CheY
MTPTATPSPTPACQGTAYTVLTVDDSPMTRAVIRRTLGMTQLPVTVIEAADGQQGLTALRNNRVDLIFADLNMPVMDGVAMIRALCADNTLRSVPVVVISADPNQERRQELAGLGVKGFLSKPFTPEKLRDLFTAAIGAPCA